MSIQRHTAFNLLGAMVPLALSVATIPLYITTVGEARYGVLAIAWLLLGYFGLFDLGLGAATAQRIAVLKRSSRQDKADVYWTALLINLGLGILGGLILWPVALYVSKHFLLIEAPLRDELIRSIPWLVTAVAVATLSGVLTGALQGMQRFLELNATSILSSTLAQVVPLLVALHYGPYLPWLIAAVLLARVIAVGIMFWFCHTHLTKGQPIRIARSTAKALLKFGGWISVSSVVGPLMVVLDRFLIGSIMGPKSVTHYTVPFQVTERFVVFPAALSSALAPRMASSTLAESRELVPTALQSLSCLLTPAAIIGLIMIEPFLAWWISPVFASHAGLPAQILVVGFWVSSFAQIPFSQLRARGRPDLVAKCHLGELLPYLGFLYLSVHLWGIIGAAVAFLARVTLDCVLLMTLAKVPPYVFASLAAKLPSLMIALGLGLLTRPWTPEWLFGTGCLVIWSVVSAWSSAPDIIRQRFSNLAQRYNSALRRCRRNRKKHHIDKFSQ